MKNAPLPLHAPSVNGVHSASSSPSPQLPSKRPPSDPKLTANAKHVNGTVNGVAPRTSVRQRKDTQKSAEGSNRTGRNNSLGGKNKASELLEQNRRKLPKKLPPQPYGKGVQSISRRAARLTALLLSSIDCAYPPQIQRLHSVFSPPSPPYPLPVRSARWQFWVQLAYAGHSGAYPSIHDSS